MRHPLPLRPGRERGFSLIELLVVVAIIVIMAAISLPAISRYIRNYQMKGALSGVASEINTARGKAIMRNVNYGIAFVVLSNNTYRWVIEDMPNGTRAAMTDLVGTGAQWDAQRGTIGTLPTGITFASSCAGFTGNASYFGFNRLGARCTPGSSGCVALATVGLANSIQNGTTSTVVCVQQDANNDGTPEFKSTVTIGAGGRVVTKM